MIGQKWHPFISRHRVTMFLPQCNNGFSVHFIEWLGSWIIWPQRLIHTKMFWICRCLLDIRSYRKLICKWLWLAPLLECKPRGCIVKIYARGTFSWAFWMRAIEIDVAFQFSIRLAIPFILRSIPLEMSSSCYKFQNLYALLLSDTKRDTHFPTDIFAI